MKKLLLTLLAIGTAGTAAISVVACGKDAAVAGAEGQRVVVVTDSGKVDDESFNQSAYDAMKEYMKDSYGLDASGNYVQPDGDTIASMEAGYKTALSMGADALVLPGFKHTSTLPTAIKLMGDKTIVAADIDVESGALTTDQIKHVIGLTYAAERSGFAAAFNAANWAVNNKDKADTNGDGVITMGTFGGLSNKTASDNYNWGYLAGVETFNEIQTAKGETELVKFSASNSTDGTAAGISATGNTDQKWFTGDYFLASDGSIRTIGTFKDDTDIIFGVAGPQIQDAFNVIPNAYYIGVDVDQASSLSEAGHNHILTSATKDLKGSMRLALEHASSLKDKDGNFHDATNWEGHTVKDTGTSWTYSAVDGKNVLKSADNAVNFQEDNANLLEVANILGTDYAATGETPETYFKGSVITAVAAKIVASTWGQTLVGTGSSK